jgi:hypothetical protein
MLLGRHEPKSVNEFEEFPSRHFKMPNESPALPAELFGCSPEELELDVVWIPKCDHGVRCIRWLLDSRMGNSQGVETLCPFVQVLPLRDQELKMVEAGKELVERLPRPTRVLDQADFEPGAWLS